MNYKAIETSEIPAFEVISQRLSASQTTFEIVKAGYEFDCGIYRIVLERKDKSRTNLDLPGNFLCDIRDDSHGDAEYTSGLAALLNVCIMRGLSIP